MADIAVWGRHTFVISAQKVYGFEELKVKAQRKTKDKEKNTGGSYGKQTYTTKDPAQPTEVSLKAKLYAALGVPVRSEAKKWLEDAHIGQSSKLLVNGKEIVPCSLRLVTAEVSEIEINANGEWASCEVNCTFKQSGVWSKMSGSSGASKKNSKSSSKKKSNTKYSSHAFLGITSGSGSKEDAAKKAAKFASVSSSANKKSSNVTKLNTSGR